MNTSLEAAFLELAPADMIAWGVRGSRLYGLATPSSDMDFLAIRSEGRKESIIMVGELDVRLIPLPLFMRTMEAGAPELVDFLQARSFTVTAPEYAAHLANLRFSSNTYFSKARRQAHTLLRIMKNVEERKGYKAVKASVRFEFLAWKMLKQREEFTPFFTPQDASYYWKLVDEAVELFRAGAEAQEVIDLVDLRSRSYWGEA